MSKVKYIAAGFQKDSENLLEEFLLENSTNFTVFITKWKEHNFGLIFAGRDNEELQQVTNEMFQVTLGYLQSNSTIFQIGAVYLLYALYRNQKCSPPVQIRITLPQWEVIRKLKTLSEKNCYMHLHYVINYLHTKAFSFVISGLLFGPICSKGKIDITRSQIVAPFSLEDSKAEMQSICNSNLLGEIETLSREYVSLGKKYNTVFFDKEKRNLDLSQFSKYIDNLDNLLKEGTKNAKISKKSVDFDSDLGCRRAKIKSNQFSRKALFRQLNASDSDDDKEFEPVKDEGGMMKKRRNRRRRPPKEKRRVGRPRKYNIKVETDESDHGSKVNGIKGPKPRGPSQRTSYTAKYELKAPTFSKKIFKDFLPDFSSESSEEQTSEQEADNNMEDIATDDLKPRKVKEEPKDSDDAVVDQHSEDALEIYF